MQAMNATYEMIEVVAWKISVYRWANLLTSFVYILKHFIDPERLDGVVGEVAEIKHFMSSRSNIAHQKQDD
jgi:hypothetical protein